MKFFTILLLTFYNFRTNKTRTLLTILGVSIGIGSVVFLISLGYGLQKLTLEKLTAAKSFNSLEVTTGNSAILEITDKTLSDFKAIKGVDKVAASLQLAGQSQYQNTTTDTTLIGFQPGFLDLEGLKPQSGQLPEASAQEVVLSKAVLNNLGITDPSSVLNQSLAFVVSVPIYADGNLAVKPTLLEQRVSLKVVGILADERVAIGYVPIENFSLKNPIYSSVKISAGKGVEAKSLRKTIEDMGFTVSSVLDIVNQINKVFSIAQIVLSVFGLVALLVASIGMFNTLTISLLERIREIGIMKSLGATNFDIYKLFMAESLFMGLAGGLMGIFIGWGIGQLGNLFVARLAISAGAQPVRICQTPYMFIIYAVAFSLLVGLATGFYPARRGARLNPLDALRYE